MIKSITSNNGIVNNYSYNGFGDIRNISIVNSNIISNNDLLNITYNYDNLAQNITQLKYSSTLSPQDSALNYSSNYTYDTLDRLIKEERSDPTGKLISATQYTYDAATNITQERVTDASGQTSSISYEYDADNKLVKITNSNSTIKLTYDINGNLIDDGIDNTYVYDENNKIVRYQDKNNIQTIYKYYPNGLRASKQTADNEPIQFYYDSAKNIVNEVQGNQSSSYLMIGSERYVRLIDSQNKVLEQYPVQSGKDIVGVLDSSNNFLNQYEYDAYGKIKESSFSATISDNPFKYTKEYYDEESGLIYLRARYYNPKIKRFNSRDKSDLINRYNYVNGNPIMNIDPSGMLGIGWQIAAFAVGIVATAGLLTPLTVGISSALLFGVATVGVGAAARVAGAVASNFVTDIGLAANHQALLSSKDWGVSLLATAVSGVVGAGIGRLVGSGAMMTAERFGWSAARTTLVSSIAAGFSGGASGAIASAAITCGFTGQSFFSPSVWENIGINVAVGAVGGVLAFRSSRLTTEQAMINERIDARISEIRARLEEQARLTRIDEARERLLQATLDDLLEGNGLNQQLRRQMFARVSLHFFSAGL
ncbi:MAG: hypothetical protein GBAus27B_000247 [Mycoplasmataceae bacterium]|nr:MAG: hypothetical protein GBAus27B_000247 [Mycoplasmataceae bacterium]